MGDKLKQGEPVMIRRARRTDDTWNGSATAK